jgi:DnaJ domain
MSTGSSGQRGSSPPPGPKKSVDELKKERQEAQEQLEELLHTGRPRNLGEGVVNGVSTIVAGAVGAAGIAVMAPAMGLVAGTSAGGIVGGAVGVAFGAVVGIVGGAAIAVTSAISGVVHIGRGVVAVPSSLSKPTQGYWWNESTHSWIYTDMTKESTKLLDIPDDDSDILRKYEDEIDGTSSTTGTAGDVVDPYYYECLEVPTNADPSLIKRRYYILARQYHPDKVGTDDKESAEKFKEVAEAYQVLIDPELRKKYDKDGRAGLSPDKTSVADDNRFSNIDPALLFAFLFGSDKFHAYVGRYVLHSLNDLNCFL